MVLKSSDFFVPLIILISSPGYEPFRKREKECLLTVLFKKEKASVDCPF